MSQLEDDRKLVTRIDQFGKGLTPFEIDFVESCLRRLEGGEVLAVQIDDRRVS